MDRGNHDEEESLLQHGERALHNGEQHARRAWSGFLDFALQGNILDVAFGLILAATFTTVVTSLVSDILLPPLSIILPINRNLEEKFAVLQAGPNLNRTEGYNTLKLAMDDGAVVLAYGAFLSKCINFLGLGISLYIIAKIYECVSKDPIVKHLVKCRYCRKYINEKAARCVNCTSWQDGREDD